MVKGHGQKRFFIFKQRKMADEQNDSIPEPPYKKNLERLAALQDRLSKVQKTAESLLATVSGTGSSSPPPERTSVRARLCPLISA